MKKISEEVRNNIFNLLGSNLSAKKIAKQCHVDIKTVSTIRNQARPKMERLKGGRPAKITEGTSRLIHRSVTLVVTNTATKVAREPHKSGITDVHPITVRRTLRRSGLVARKKIKKPRLYDHHKKLRYKFAKSIKIGQLKSGVESSGAMKQDQPSRLWRNQVGVEESGDKWANGSRN